MRLGIVAPSSPVFEPSLAARGLRELRRCGFEVELAPHTGDYYGRLAGPDQDRADDLVAMLERPDIDGVVCLRGGYGAMRTALAMDLPRLRRLRGQRPKPFVGYSDITVIHSLLASELGWVTFYGPMVTSFASVTEYTRNAFLRTLTTPEGFVLDPDPADPYVETLVPGVATGEIAGGCLALLSDLIGTPWEPDFTDKIVFFESVRTEPHQVESQLAHLLAAGKLSACRGLVIGEHADCGPKTPGPTLGLEQIFEDLLTPLKIPTIYHLPLGHGASIATVPLGVPARLDADNRQVTVLDGGVE
jgi:muramoyltetrapeptide carboxypeptidase